MQLDFKLKKMKEMKKRTFYALSAFSCSSGIMRTNVYSVNISACPGTLSPRFLLLFQFPVSLLSSKKRVNCIVDSTVSSLYETI